MLRHHEEPLFVVSWVPRNPLVVLGSSNRAATEVAVERCREKQVPILKRYGGGGTVILYRGCLVVSIGTWVGRHFHNELYFRLLNQALITCLGQRWESLKGLKQDGISDIVAGSRKVAGTSLFRSRNYLLYQASIIIDLDIVTIENFLKHPSKEPTYRQGRSHGQFLLGLDALESSVTPELIAEHFDRNLATKVAETLGKELVSPVAKQFGSLEQRLARASKADQD